MAKRKILIVDDEKDFTDMIKLNLELTGKYDVKVENKGRDALAAARQLRPDLIFLDIIMPDMDGGAVLFNLRNDRETRDIPVVFLTAIVGKSDRGDLGNAISDRPFLAKPVTASELMECIVNNIR